MISAVPPVANGATNRMDFSGMFLPVFYQLFITTFKASLKFTLFPIIIAYPHAMNAQIRLNESSGFL
jgi:ABC-type spermidine/putrescine transport system permease subunit I